MKKHNEAIDFIIMALERATDERPRGKLGEIARAAGVDQSTLTYIKAGKIRNPGVKTLMGIIDAIFKIYPDLKTKNYQLIYKKLFGTISRMDDIEALNMMIDVLAYRDILSPDLLKALMGTLSFTYSQLPKPTAKEGPMKDRTKNKN